MLLHTYMYTHVYMGYIHICVYVHICTYMCVYVYTLYKTEKESCYLMILLQIPLKLRQFPTVSNEKVYHACLILLNTFCLFT